VAVAVDETGDGELVVEVDNPGVGADIGFDLGIGTDGDEDVAASSEGLGAGLGVVEGENIAVYENQMGRRLSKRLRAAGEEE